MRRNVLEAFIFLVFGFVASAEGIRLTLQHDLHAMSDAMGPGRFILFLGLALVVVAVCHFALHSVPHAAGAAKQPVDQQLRRRMIAMVVALALYVFGIELVGYLIATPLFFLAQFKLAGVHSWKQNVLLSAIIAAVYYVVFVQYCDMMFPSGLLY